MKPGRELDVLIAEKVMGWTNIRKRSEFPYGTLLSGIDHITNMDLSIPNYSENISAAWEVVEKLSTNGWAVKMQIGFDSSRHYWDCEVFIEESHYGSAKTAPHAICVAALAAVGVKV